MISLDQVLLLEQKVESAVEKIQQLEAENDALRNKCSELTNALSEKTEQLSAYESEQTKIESGIIKAIDRLNSIENSVLKAAGQSAPAAAAAAPEPESIAELKAQNFDSMETVEEPAPQIDEDLPESEPEPEFDEINPEDSNAEGESTDELGFDIF